jgi:hydroxyethylthiazole kinase-like uncharacterized protein yjeF
MRTICSVATVRRAEGTAGVPEPVLMQRAATALAGACVEVLRGRRGALRGARVVALVGSGNNGGDALWALAGLAARGVGATAVGDVHRMHAAGAAAARSAGVRILEWSDPAVPAALAGADLALDGIVGIGGTGGLREPAAGAVRALAAAGVPIVAVDVPSGVDSDTGEVVAEAVAAVATVCFGVLKPGLLVAPGRHHAGAVTVVDIGLRPEDLEPVAEALVLADLAPADPPADTHKYRRGVVGVTAGSPPFPGAALLAVGGARLAGTGMVAFTPGTGATGVEDPVAAMVVARHPDVVLDAARRVDARCLGPGLGSGPAVTDLVLAALADPCPVVVDASALDVLVTPAGAAALADRAGAGLVTVLTPHSGEFARLGLDPAGGPLSAARRAAERTGAVLVRKGPGTVVAAPGGTTYVDTFGSAALATAGSGDVLSGLMAGMLAAGARAGRLTAGDAALLAARAVGLHGLAGRLAAAGGAPVTATDVLAHLPAACAVAAGATA